MRVGDVELQKRFGDDHSLEVVLCGFEMYLILVVIDIVQPYIVRRGIGHGDVKQILQSPRRVSQFHRGLLINVDDYLALLRQGFCINYLRFPSSHFCQPAFLSKNTISPENRLKK